MASEQDLLIGAALVGGGILLLAHANSPTFPPQGAGKTPYQNPTAQNISAGKGNETAQDLSAGAATIASIGSATASIIRAVNMGGPGAQSPNDYTRNNGMGYQQGSGAPPIDSFQSSAVITAHLMQNTGSGGDDEQNA
jgi:hypothetical protein